MPGESEDTRTAKFMDITDASDMDATRYLKKYQRLDSAIDAYFNDLSRAPSSSRPSTTKIIEQFNRYKDKDGDDITVDGTVRLCEDLEVDLEDVGLLALAYELESPGVGLWPKQEWIRGWKSLGCDDLDSMKRALPSLRERLRSEPEYFTKVYTYTFKFAQNEGQRSLAIETAKEFWALLLPHGLQGRAIPDANDGKSSAAGHDWMADRIKLWFQFLDGTTLKGISKDTWIMFLDFFRTTNSNYSNYDMEAAWPSTIDEFVESQKTKKG